MLVSLGVGTLLFAPALIALLSLHVRGQLGTHEATDPTLYRATTAPRDQPR
jgi:hypothetical protein